MNLFLDTISPENILILFDDNKNILKKYIFDVRQNESTLLIEELDKFLLVNNLKYQDLENIVVVNWPWSFTWVRTTVLLVNTINFVIKKNITTLNYFDLFFKYPIIKTSSKRDSFVKFSFDKDIEVLDNNTIIEQISWNFIKTYWDQNFINLENNSKPNYDEIIKNIKLNKNKIISPFYFKKPNIS